MKRNVKQMVLVFLVLCLVFVVGIDTFAASKKAKSVTLNHKEYTVKNGKSVKLKATVSPKNSKNKKIEWSSSNKKVATVNSKGKVTAKKQGTAKITAKVKGTKIKAVCKITVGQPISKITVKEKKVTLLEGETAKVNATIKPAKASNKKLAYSSSNESVVTVDAKGVMTAKASGKATITAKATDGSKKKATVKVTVNKKETEDNDADKDNTVDKDTNNNTNSNTNNNTDGNTDSNTDTNEGDVENQAIPVTGVTLSPSSKALKLNETLKLVATVLPENATNKNVTFHVVSGENIVSVDANGLVTANAVGTAVVSVVTEDGQKKATCQLIITESGGTQIGSKIKTVTGVVSISETEPAVGAKIYLIPYSNETTEENVNFYIEDAPYVTQTNENGEYRLEEVAVDYYYLLVKCAGYMDVVKSLPLTEAGTLNYTVEKILLVETGENGEDLPNCTLSGSFSSIKESKKVIPGLTVRIREGKDNISGDYLQETYTDENGEYTFENLMPGVYTVQVIDYRHNEEVGYFAEYFPADVRAGIRNIRSGQLYPVYAGNEIRFRLHWNGNDKVGASVNLNSHLIGPKNGNSGEFHVWHEEMECYDKIGGSNSVLSADLYCDGFDGGPEKTTIYVPQDGEYKFYVFDYLTRNKTGAKKLATSTPIVEVYQGCNLRAVYEMPEQAGNLWYVCSYDAEEDRFVTGDVVTDWTKGESLIGEDETLNESVKLASSLNIARRVVENLTVEEDKVLLENVIEQAQTVYETSCDSEKIKNANSLLTEKINSYESLVEISDIHGDGLLSYWMDDNVIHLKGLTSSIPECEWETKSNSTVEVVGDDATHKQIIVSNPVGYKKVYDVTYTWNEERCLGIKSVKIGSNNVDFTVQKSKEGDFYILRVPTYAESLGSGLAVNGSNGNADVVVEESDKEEYDEKVTISYKGDSRVYYFRYAATLPVFDIASVTDGENTIVSYDHSGDDRLRVLHVIGYEAQISDAFTVSTKDENVEIEMKESDNPQYAKKIEMKLDNASCLYYVKYEMDVKTPRILKVIDKERGELELKPGDYSNIDVYGVDDMISKNLEIIVPEGMVYEIDFTGIDCGYRYFHVTVMNPNHGGWSKEYTLFYEMYDYAPQVTGVTDDYNDFCGFEVQNNKITIYGKNKVMGETIQIIGSEGTTVSPVEWDDTISAYKITASKDGRTKSYQIAYYQTYSFFDIYDIEDPNNAIIVERTYDPLIKDFWIRGFNDEIGNTLEVVVEEGLQYQIEYTEPGQSDCQAYITVINGEESYRYNIHYVQDEKSVLDMRIMDENGDVPYYLPGVSENSIYICGDEEELGDDVRFSASNLFSVSEVTYDEENDNYHVTFSKDNVSITYSIYYYQNADFHYVNGVRDAYNEIQVDGIDGVNYGLIRIVGKNPELGNTLEIILNEAYETEYEVDYDVAESSDFDAVITITHAGSTYQYFVYYVVD